MSSQPAPLVSVIIPVHNGGEFLRRCLEAVLAADGTRYECIVVNDASTDASKDILAEFGNRLRVLNLPTGPQGPAYARNRGAEVARGEILFFVDADVVLAAGAVERVAKTFCDQPGVAAVFGSYDASPGAPGLVSQYRNLLHHFVHQNGNPNASTFWAGCGGVRRDIFENLGGFDERRFPRPSIEDIEFGYRLRKLGYRIFLDKGLQAKHLKCWTLYSMIRTDIVCRAVPWSRLILQTKIVPDDLNVKVTQRASFMLAATAAMLLVLSALRPECLVLSIASLAAVFCVNRKLYGFFWHTRGLMFAVGCLPLHLLYYFYSGLSYAYTRVAYDLERVGVTRWQFRINAALSLKNPKPSSTENRR
jgi:hypothetical protein